VARRPILISIPLSSLYV